MIKNMFMKYFLILSIIQSIILTLSISDLLTMWLIMEINNFLFTTLLSFELKNKKVIFLYYLIQILPSFFMILGITLNNINLYLNPLSMLFIFLGLMIKLGVPPFHYWMIIISNYMPWIILYIFLTLQKIIPFYFLSLCPLYHMFFLFMIISSSILPPILMFNITSFKKILTYSSINQNSWMLLLMSMKMLMWLLYLVMYMIISSIIFYLINLNKMTYMYSSKNLNVLMLMMMLNMAGMPPFSFFLFKWFSIFLINYNSDIMILPILMMLSSFLMFYIYINMMYLHMFFYGPKLKISNSQFYTHSYKMMYMMLFLLSSLIFLMI